MDERSLAHTTECDAQSLYRFMQRNVEALDEHSRYVVYVENDAGLVAHTASFQETTLTDGSKVYNLRLTFD